MLLTRVINQIRVEGEGGRGLRHWRGGEVVEKKNRADGAQGVDAICAETIRALRSTQSALWWSTQSALKHFALRYRYNLHFGVDFACRFESDLLVSLSVCAR